MNIKSTSFFSIIFLFCVAYSNHNNLSDANEEKKLNNKFDIRLAFEKEKIAPIVVIGSGPAGLTSAYYGARAGFHTVCIAGKTPGGQITETSYIENFPGYEKIEGYVLMDKIRGQAEAFGAVIVDDTVTKVDFNRWPFLVKTESGDEINALAVIVATGAAPRRLGIPGEIEYWGKGVTACAICDCLFFKNKDVVVIGGGDAAIEEAMQLATYSKSVTILVRTDRMRAARSVQNKISDYENIKIVYNKKILEVIGDGSVVTGIKLQDSITDEISVLDMDGVFLAIGQNPNTSLFEDSLNLSKTGYIVLEGRSQATSCEGVFAAGDDSDSRYRQASTAAGDGAKAALEVVDWLRDHGLTDLAAKRLKSRYYKFN